MSFSKIEWLAAVRRSKIPADQQRVISEIGDTANRDGLDAWKYTGELTTALGVQSRTVTNARRAAVDAGFLVVTREPPKGRPSKQVKSWTTEYRLTIPDEKVSTQMLTFDEKVSTQMPTFDEKVFHSTHADVRSTHADERSTHESAHVRATPSGSSSGNSSGSASGSARAAARAAGEHAAIVDELLRSAISDQLPRQTLNRLRNEAIELLEELEEPNMLAAALRLWNERPDAKPGLLPHLYSDVVREQAAGTQSDSAALEAEARRAAITQCQDCDEHGQIDYGNRVSKCQHPKLHQGPVDDARSA